MPAVDHGTLRPKPDGRFVMVPDGLKLRVATMVSFLLDQALKQPATVEGLPDTASVELERIGPLVTHVRCTDTSGRARVFMIRVSEMGGAG